MPSAPVGAPSPAPRAGVPRRGARVAGRLPPRHRGPAGDRDPHRARLPRRPPAARRLRRRRRLLRHLRLPHHRPARGRARPQRVDLVDPVRGAPDPAPAARRGARARAPSRRCRTFVVPGLRRRDIGVDVMAAAAYVVNWVFARRETDYLASDVLPSPVQHFWSLAVEEQFYVIWPLLLIVLALVVRRPSRRVVALALGALVASSFAWSVWFSHTSPQPGLLHDDDPHLGARHRRPARRRPGRPAPADDPGPRVGGPGLGRARRAARRRGAGCRRASTGRAPGRCCPPCRRRCSSGSAGRGRLAAPCGCSAPPRWCGSAPCPTRSTSGTGRSSSWAAGSPPTSAAPSRPGAWSRSPCRPCGPPGCPGGSSSPRSTTARGCATARAPCSAAGLALSCVGVLAALPLFALRSPFKTTPPGGALPPLSQLGAATLQPGRPFVAVDDPGWVTPDPLVSGQDRPEGRRRPLPGRRRPPPTGGLHVR